MTKATFSQFRQNMKSYLEAVKKGETICITSHGQIVAEVRPPMSSHVPSWKNPKFKPIKASGPSVTEILDEMREDRF